MKIMGSEPQVREGEANERRCSENTLLSRQNVLQKYAVKPRVGGHKKCVKVITVTHVQNQQVDPSTTTTSPQPELNCGRVTNSNSRQAYGQCIQSNPCSIVNRQDEQLTSISSCFPKQLPSNLFEQKMLCAESLSFLNFKLSDCVERKKSVASVMSERGVAAKIQPKLLQQNPSVFEGNARAWPI